MTHTNNTAAPAEIAASLTPAQRAYFKPTANGPAATLASVRALVRLGLLYDEIPRADNLTAQGRAVAIEITGECPDRFHGSAQCPTCGAE